MREHDSDLSEDAEECPYCNELIEPRKFLLHVQDCEILYREIENGGPSIEDPDEAMVPVWELDIGLEPGGSDGL